MEDTAILAGNKSVEDKIHELENGRNWFQSRHQELVKHSGFEQGMGKMNQLMLGLAELKGKRAVENLSEKYSKKAAAAFRLPAEAYKGADKE